MAEYQVIDIIVALTCLTVVAAIFAIIAHGEAINRREEEKFIQEERKKVIETMIENGTHKDAAKYCPCRGYKKRHGNEQFCRRCGRSLSELQVF
jgi:hypothetical protein